MNLHPTSDVKDSMVGSSVMVQGKKVITCAPREHAMHYNTGTGAEWIKGMGK